MNRAPGAVRSQGAASVKRPQLAEVLVVACLPLLAAALSALLSLFSWQFDFRPTDHPIGYWGDAGKRIRDALWLGAVAAGSAGACCVASLCVPHHLRTSGWAIVLLSISGLLLAGVVLVGASSAEMAYRISTSP